MVNTHHHAQRVETFLAESPWRDQIIVAHEEALLGTGGTVLANRKHLDGGPFMVVHADNLSRFRVEDFLAAHRSRSNDCVMTMMLFHTPTPQTCGIVELDDQQRVIRFHEKVPTPPGNLANGAVYIMEPETLNMLAEIKGENKKPDLSLNLILRCLG